MHMKPTALTLMTGLALALAAQAGTPNTAPIPAPDPGLREWFIGGSVGYLTDLDEAMYHLQAGAEFKTPGTHSTQAFYLEVGFTQDDASYSYSPPPPTAGGRSEAAKIDLNIIPITANYKYEAALTGHLNCYLGLGLGIAILDSSYDWSWFQAVTPPNNHGEGGDNQTDVRFYGNVFAGLSYDFSDAFEIFGGVRYIFMDNMDHTIDVTHAPAYSAGINNDFLFELGARYHF